MICVIKARDDCMLIEYITDRRECRDSVCTCPIEQILQIVEKGLRCHHFSAYPLRN